MSSKFAGVLAAKRETDATEESVAPLAALPSAEAKRRGRPNAKRSDPEFVQTTAYIRRDTHRDAKIALLHEGEGREYSELVEELLAGWLKSRKYKDSTF